MNKKILAEKTNELSQAQKSTKYQLNTIAITNNKINIRRCASNVSTKRSPQGKDILSSQIKIIPNQLHFQSIQARQLYEIPFYVRNDSNELQKIRIIPPTKKQFKIKYSENFNNQIAAGLAVKISVLFCSDDFCEKLEDKVIVLGDSFKHQMIIIAQGPKFDFEFPEILNVGTLILKQQRKIQIPIKNKGSRPGTITIQDIKTNQYCPNISYPNKGTAVVAGKTQILEVLIKPVILGEHQLKVCFSSMESCIIKLLVVQDQVQIIDQNGSKILIKDFGQLLIGQRLSFPFFVANSTQNKIQATLHAFNKKKQQVDIKFDRKRSMFIAETSPQQFSAQVQMSSVSIQSSKMNVNAFQSVKNKLYVQKVPQKQEINLFVQNLTKHISSSIYKAEYAMNHNNNLINMCDPNQLDNLLTGRSNVSSLLKTNISASTKDKLINETLAVKFSNQDRIVKIPVKFLAKIPNLQINVNSFDFGAFFIKQTSEKQFVLKNLSNRNVNLSFVDSTTNFKENFKLQGPESIQANSQQKYILKFRPLIKKKFSQKLTIKVFDHFPIEIKIFAQCLGADTSSLKHQMSLTMTDRKNALTGRNASWKSLLKDKSMRQQTQQGASLGKLFKTTNITQKSSVLLNHRSLIMNPLIKNQQKKEQQMAKLVSNYRQQNMTQFKQVREGLFFKKQEYLKSTQRKKPQNQLSNLRQILRYQTLNLSELKKIQVAEKSLEFGHIFIGSKTHKKLKITNKLQTPILFQIDVQQAEQLSQNSQQPVKIQGYATYQVEINLLPTELGELQLPLTYVINRQHIFEIKISAIVTLVNLELSSRSFVFNFNEDQRLFEKQETLKVYNNGNKTTKFFFQTPQNKSFRLSAMEGQLEPKSYVNIKIIYAPLNGEESGQQKVHVEKLKMKVQDGAQNVIKCTGSVKQPKITIKQTDFTCETSLISVPITNKITVKNHSKVQTFIKIQLESANSNLSIEQIQSFFSWDDTIYCLNSEEKRQIAFTFTCHEARKIEANIVVSIRGYKVTKIPFCVNFIYPQVHSLNSLINFKNVPIMSNNCIQMFSLINTTQTQIKLEIDPSYPKDEYFCQILAVKQKNLELNYEEQKNRTFLYSFLAAFKDKQRLSKRRSIICNKILTLPSGQQSVFNIKFVPKCIKKYEFQLPLRVYGCVDKIIRPINLQIQCNAIDPVIYVQPQAIKYDTKVICQAKSSYSQSLFISNPHNYSVRFKIEPIMRNAQSMPNNKKLVSMNSTINQKFRRQYQPSANLSHVQNFVFSQYNGQIEPTSKIQIFLTFKPTVEGQFLQKFNISLGPKGQQTTRMQLTDFSSHILDVNGSAILPTLKFNCNQAIMPIVPLNLESRIFIMIQNHGYDAITICKWKTSNNFAHTQIKVNFIEGKLLSLAKKSLRIEVLFSSLSPISFTTMLQLYDEYGNKYELPLSCTAQNCIFTSYPYLQSDNQHTILFENKQKLIKIVSIGKNPYYEQNKQMSGNHSMSCLFIKKWLNFQLNMSLKNYPESIIQSEGKQFVKLVNRISSKNIIKKNEFLEGQPSQRFNQTQLSTQANFDQPKGSISKILGIYELYSQTIKKLKSEGAFLNSIRPQFLFNYSQFVCYQNHKRSLVCSQSVFQVVSVQSWVALFYQLCKIYVQPQITEKILTKLKIQSPLFSHSNLTSNLYSPVEMLLLKFINFYFSYDQSSLHQSHNAFVNFTEQIKIFEVIQKILESNFQLVLTQQINSLKNSVSIMSPHVFLSAISKFLHVQLKQLGLSAYLATADLFTMGVKQLVLYLINLVQMIYHYSNANFVKFQGAVGDKITKVIELENPTTKKINYFVKIVNSDSSQKQHQKGSRANEGLNKNSSQSSDNLKQVSLFISQKSQITIEPKQKSELKVVYHCKNAKGQSANLYLIPTKQDDDYTIPQPLLFKLTTTILSKIVMKKINVVANMYEVCPIHLDIELPSQIPQSAEFCLSLYEQSPNNQVLNNNLNSLNPPSFIFSQSHMRTLKEGNRDSVGLKLVPLSLGQKICKISYLSSLYGQFIYEIHAKITNPKILKEYRIKDLSVNVDEQVNIFINKQNQLLNSVVKIYYPDLYNIHNRTQKNIVNPGTKRNISSTTKLTINSIEKLSPKELKYDVQVLDNQYVTLAKGCNSIQKLDLKENKIILKANFTKPFKEYSCLLSVKNQLLKDSRLYKIVFIVTSPPKVIKMQFKTAARQKIIQRIPIKLAPCQVSLKTNCQCFTVQNLCKQYLMNNELICHFNPSWIQQKQAVIEIQNKQSLEQVIYQISLKAEQPQKFALYELTASSLFNEQISIPVQISAILSQEEEQTKSAQGANSSLISQNNHNKKGTYFQVKRLFKRPHSIESQQFYPFLNKANKSNTGLYLKMSSSTYNLKQTAEKLKVPKTKSMVQEKNYKHINFIFNPSQIQSQSGSIRLCKPHSQEYYWAKVIIKNRKVAKLNPIKLQQKINHTKKQSLQSLILDQKIDFQAPDFQFKFEEDCTYLKFSYEYTQDLNSTFKNLGSKLKQPFLVFSPFKEIQTERKLFFKSNNKQYMLPIQLKADPLPTVIVPEITTTNVEAKHTYLNLINSTQHTGEYKVVTQRQNDPKNRCIKFIQGSNERNEQIDTAEKYQNGMSYVLKAKQKKQIKIYFKPSHIHQKQKFVVKFESQTLPNYTYILNGRSEFKVQQENLQFQVYEDNLNPFMIKFTNLFEREEYFTLELQELEEKQAGINIQDSVKIQDPINKKFTLKEIDTKGIFLSVRESYFSQLRNSSNSAQESKANGSMNLKFNLNIKIGQKIVKKYQLSLLIIKNLFTNHSKKTPTFKNVSNGNKDKVEIRAELHKMETKKQISSKKFGLILNCKARETVYETIEIPSELNFTVKQIKCPPEILKYLTFTCINQNQGQNCENHKLNHLKIKYSPLKPFNKNKHDFILVGQNGEKYRIQAQVCVQEPPIDDTIILKTTQIDQISCVSFKLTNTTKFSAKYKAYFSKKLPQFSLQTDHGILQGYGKPGTPIFVKFKSHINNRCLQEKLIIQTEDMYWCFKVKGMMSKDCRNQNNKASKLSLF